MLFKRISPKRTEFWAAEQRDDTIFTQSGSAGTKGRTSYRMLASEAEAKRVFQTRVQSKLREGFHQTDEAHAFGTVFPGATKNRRVTPAYAFARMSQAIREASPSTLEELADAFAGAFKDRMKSRYCGWYYRFEGSTAPIMRLARHYLPAHTEDNIHHWCHIGCVGYFKPDAVENSSMDAEISELSSPRAFRTMMAHAPEYQARKHLKVTSVEFYSVDDFTTIGYEEESAVD